MKEELQGKLVEILTSIQTAAGKASDFAMEQLPDIAQSYVAYGRTVETAEFLVPTLAFVALLWAWLRKVIFNASWVSDRGHDKGEWTEGRIFACIGCIGGGLFFLMVAMLNFAQFAMVWLSPKVWLLKEIATLIR